MLGQGMPQVFFISVSKFLQSLYFWARLNYLSCKGREDPFHMPHKVITSLIPEYDKLKDSTVFLGLTFLSLFLRWPFFFRDYIDRDESTFILVAQSWVDGQLPYTQLWDLKPPLVFFFFAVIIYVFGKSFVAIRLFGAIAVAVIALYTYKLGKEVHSRKTGFWSAVGSVYMLSLFGSVQGVMSEHLSILFFVPALYLIAKDGRYQWFFVSGFLLGLSLMMKLNLAYAVVGISLWLLYRGFNEQQALKGILRVIFLGFGVAIGLGVTFLPYLQADMTQVWTDSVIQAPLAYSRDQQSSILHVLPLSVILLALGVISWRRKWLDFSDRGTQLLAVVVTGVVFSFLKSGKVNGHYLMQIYPFLLILLGIVLYHAVSIKSHFYGYALLLLFLLPVETYVEIASVIKNKTVYGTYFNGEGFTVPDFIRENDLEQENVLFFEYHIGYWLLEASPPTKAATHPSNICRTSLYPYFNNPRKSALSELKYLLEDLKPGTVVTRKGKSVFDKEYVAEDTYVRGYLAEHYRLAGISGKAEIFSRLEGH
jgi:hypothetical protein